MRVIVRNFEKDEILDSWSWREVEKIRPETPARLSYSNKVILSPMVRAGRLPLRLLALQYGADIVFCEEHIDRKMLKCKRVENSLLDTVDYVLPDGKCEFRTCQLEKDRVVFQMGTADPELALMTARMVENDVAGIDVNMGCPKDYSTLGGMGAALLTQPDKVRAILTTLVQGVKKPITCKIRLLPSLTDTLSLAKVIESTGVAAMTVHGRLKEERPEQPCHPDLIREVAQSVSIPVIANGGSLNISTYSDIMAFKEATGCCSVMVARSALNNPSVFRKDGPLPAEEVVQEFLKTALRFDESMGIIKYCLSIMLKSLAKRDSAITITQSSVSANSLRELSKLHKLLPFYDSLQAERERASAELPLSKQKELHVGTFSPSPAKRAKMDMVEIKNGIHELHIKYDKRSNTYGDKAPKAMVIDYAKKQKLPPPGFTVMEDENRLYRAVVTLGELKYTSSMWSSSKKLAEHSASLVALTHCGALHLSSPSL